MMPTAAQVEDDALARRRRMFEPPIKVIVVPDRGSPPGVTADAWEGLVAVWWTRERAARIARGACPVCAEKLCPMVGGRDAACCP